MNQSLVQNQHTFPTKSIERFCDDRGNVEAFYIESGRAFPVRPKNKLFCYNRVWDQRAEQGFGKQIEDKFQALVEYIINSSLTELPNDGHCIVTEFYSLWRFRTVVQGHDEDMLPGNFSPTNFTKEEKESLEMRHVIFADETGDIPIHMKRGQTIFSAIDGFSEKYSWLRWYLCKTPVQLIVPDNPGENFIIPIQPNLCLIAHFDINEMKVDDIIRFNVGSILRSKKYYFANKLGACFNA